MHIVEPGSRNMDFLFVVCQETGNFPFNAVYNGFFFHVSAPLQSGTCFRPS